MLIISILLVALFVGAAIWKEHKIPDSISSLVYVFKYKWTWTMWIWSVGILLLPSLLESLGSAWQFLGFLTIVMLLFCGAMPLFDKENNTLHNIFGVSACVLSQLCVAMINPWYLLFWMILFGICVYAYFADDYPSWLKGKGIFISEGICYISLMVSIIIH